MRWIALLALALLAGCLSPPRTHRYVLGPPRAPEASPSEEAPAVTVALEELLARPPYDDPRIVYRPSSLRLEHYHYHRWATPPARLVTDYLREALAAEPCLAIVDDGAPEDPDAVLTGDVIAIEEVDESETSWVARISLELRLRDPESGSLFWSQRYTEERPMEKQSPEGLAAALGDALDSIVRASAGSILRAIGDRREAASSTARCLPSPTQRP